MKESEEYGSCSRSVVVDVDGAQEIESDSYARRCYEKARSGKVKACDPLGWKGLSPAAT